MCFSDWFVIGWIFSGWVSVRLLAKMARIGPPPLIVGLLLCLFGPMTFVLALFVGMVSYGRFEAVSRILFGDGE
jgi:hypothetical protein